MSRFRRSSCAAFLAFLLSGSLASNAYCEDLSEIRSAYIEFPPLAHTTESGELEGSFIQLTQTIADRAGYRISWQELPIERVYLYLKNGSIDMWPGSAGVPELAAYTRETDFHTGSIQLNAYSLTGTTAVPDIDSLQGKSLILIRGYTYFRLLDHLKEDPDTRVTIAPTHRSAVRMLEFQRGDYLINFKSPMETALQQHPILGLHYDSLLNWPTTLVFSSQAPGTDKMADEMNRAWRLLQSEGRPLHH